MPCRERRDQRDQREIEAHEPLDDGQDGRLHVAGRTRVTHQFRRAAEEGLRPCCGDDSSGFAVLHHRARVGATLWPGLHRQRLARQGGLVQ